MGIATRLDAAILGASEAPRATPEEVKRANAVNRRGFAALAGNCLCMYPDPNDFQELS